MLSELKSLNLNQALTERKRYSVPWLQCVTGYFTWHSTLNRLSIKCHFRWECMEPARLPSYLLNWKPTHGKRSAGRPRSTLLHLLDDDVKTVLGDHWDIPAACKLAVNRTDWRHLLRNIYGEQADSGFLP